MLAQSVSRAQKISTVVDRLFKKHLSMVSRAQKISTVVDAGCVEAVIDVSRAQKISTVVDLVNKVTQILFHALKKFLLL